MNRSEAQRRLETTNEPTERESAVLVIAALLHEVESLRVWAEAEIAVLCARVCQLEETAAKAADVICRCGQTSIGKQ